MKSNKSKTPLLTHDLEHQRPRRGHLAFSRSLCTALICLVVSNALWLYHAAHQSPAVVVETSEFAGLSYNTTKVYHHWTEFQDPEHLEQAWASIDLTPLEVLLNDDEARAHSIEPSKYRFPWDRSQGVYYVKAFHDLHCLNVIKFELDHPSKEGREHVFHCLDALRQDIMCSADDTPMPVTTLPKDIGDGQVYKCRDFEALIRWTQQPERFPCYKRSVDHKLKNRLEAYAFCPESSPFYEIQRAYFEKWGHTPA